MKRILSYPAPALQAITSSTVGRREDCDRGTLWTEAEIDWLCRHYGRFPVKFCAEHLRRSEMSVRIKAHRIRYGIKRGIAGKRFTANTNDHRAAS